MALNKLYNEVLNYFWTQNEDKSKTGQPETEDMPHITRINRLSSLLKDTNYSQIQKQQICMFYSALIRQYNSAKSTLNFPTFLYQPPLYTPKVSFVVPINIKNQKVYCVLQLYIIFSQGLQKQMPTFYIKNPDYRKYKPNKKYVKFGKYQQENKYYESILGGLKIYLPLTSKQRWSWTHTNYFKEENILNMVRWIHKQLFLEYFPFSSRKTEQIDNVQPEAKALYNFLVQHVSSSSQQQSHLLKTIQQLEALIKVIEYQTKQLHLENIKLQQIKQPKAQQAQLSNYFPQPSNKKSQKILTTISQIQALKDTLYLLESKFNQKQITLDLFLSYSQMNISQQFEEKFKLKTLVSREDE